MEASLAWEHSSTTVRVKLSLGSVLKRPAEELESVKSALSVKALLTITAVDQSSEYYRRIVELLVN